MDGHDREVDVYNFRKANPTKPATPLLYWGKYVQHDNNRDGLGMGLALRRIMMSSFLEYHPTVLHDLHESQPFLYVSTRRTTCSTWPTATTPLGASTRRSEAGARIRATR